MAKNIIVNKAKIEGLIPNFIKEEKNKKVLKSSASIAVALVSLMTLVSCGKKDVIYVPVYIESSSIENYEGKWLDDEYVSEEIKTSDQNVYVTEESTTNKSDSVSEDENYFYYKWYDSYFGGTDKSNIEQDGYVIEYKQSDGTYVLIDADSSKIILSDYDSMSTPFYLTYYDYLNGGIDSNSAYPDSNGLVVEVVKDNLKYLYDANDFSKYLFGPYKTMGEPFFLDEYEAIDTNDFDNKSNGYVLEFTLADDLKVLVDANNFQEILGPYQDLSISDGETIVTFKDGTTSKIEIPSIESSKEAGLRLKATLSD